MKKKRGCLWIGLLVIMIIFMIILTRFPVNETKEETNIGINAQSQQIETRHPNETSIEENCSEKLGTKDNFPYSAQHWTHMPLLVYINQSGEIKVDPKENKETVDLRTTQIRDAMSRLSYDVPSIQFIEINDSDKADIIFHVYMPVELRISLASDAESNIGGLSVPVTCENLMLKANIYVSPVGLGKIDECISSNLALHELLHAFGIGHDYDAGSLMSVSIMAYECPNHQISKKHIACLKEIYSNGDAEACLGVKMYKDCGKGYIQGADYNCHKNCSEGYVAGQDYECYPECGRGYYCLSGSVCCHGKCVWECLAGSSLGDDCKCY